MAKVRCITCGQRKMGSVKSQDPCGAKKNVVIRREGYYYLYWLYTGKRCGLGVQIEGGMENALKSRNGEMGNAKVVSV